MPALLRLRVNGYGIVKRILVTGKNGQLGWELERSLRPLGDVFALSRDQLDLMDLRQCRKRVRDTKPDVIVNAAAYTAVEQAEDNAKEAERMNTLAPAVLAEEAKKIGALFIHYSTDYVFDGTKSSPYVESDATNPLNIYGRTKLEGEKAIEATGGAYLIFRTSWLYALRGKNFVLTMLRLFQEQSEVRVVDDQVGVPNWSRVIAEATAKAVVLVSQRTDDAAFGHGTGIYHLSGAGETSWFQFANEILDAARGSKNAQALAGSQAAKIVNISSAEYPSRAKRPKYSVLNSARLRESFGIVMPQWDEQLKRAFSEPA
jgi:dTDP-4-dehydrorhamnose reductase